MSNYTFSTNYSRLLGLLMSGASREILGTCNGRSSGRAYPPDRFPCSLKKDSTYIFLFNGERSSPFKHKTETRNPRPIMERFQSFCEQYGIQYIDPEGD